MIKHFIGYWGMFMSIIIVFIILVYFLLYIPSQKISKQNLENVKKITLGKSSEDVLRIMGQRGLDRGMWGIDSVYSYEAGILASSNIEIIFNEKMEVKQVISP